MTNRSGAMACAIAFTRRSWPGARKDHRKQIASASTPSAISRRIACAASSSFSATTTLPKQSTRSDTPSIRYFGTMGSGLRLSGMWTTRRMSRPVRPREPRMMWMTSLCPLVVIRPTLTPLFWTMALVPTVVPWASAAKARQSSSGRLPSLAATTSRAAIRPWAKSAGVDGALPAVTRPASSTTTQSVKVPPMSMPQR